MTYSDPFKKYDAWKTATPYDDEQEHAKDCPQYKDCEAACMCPTPNELAVEQAEYRNDCANDS